MTAATPASLPAEGLVRLRTVLQFIPVGKTTWWEGIRAGRYPAPVKIGTRAVAWDVAEIRALIERLSTAAAG